jgi:hypothetical protein
MGLDECSYARQMGAIKTLMASLPPGWQSTAPTPIQHDPHPEDPRRPGVPNPRRHINAPV